MGTPPIKPLQDSPSGSSYVFHRPLSRESGSLGDTEDDDFCSLPRPSLGFEVSSLSQPEPKTSSPMFETEMDSTIQRMHRASLEEVVVLNQSPQLRKRQQSYSLRMESMNEELDGTQKMVNDMLFSLQEPSPPREHKQDCFNQAEDDANFHAYTTRKRHLSVHPTTERLSTTSNLSFSEPDLIIASVKQGIRTTSEDRSTGEERSLVEDELLTSLPATVARKFADPSPTHLLTPSPRKGRFSIGFKSNKRTERNEKPRKSMPSSQLHPSSSLYFMAQDTDRKVMTSPARAGFGSLFKKKEKGRINKSMSINFTDGTPETSSKKAMRVRRNTSFGPIKIEELSTSESIINPFVPVVIVVVLGPMRCSRDRGDDGSPRMQRRASIKNFTLSAKIFVVLNKWIEMHFEVNN